MHSSCFSIICVIIISFIHYINIQKKSFISKKVKNFKFFLANLVFLNKKMYFKLEPLKNRLFS